MLSIAREVIQRKIRCFEAAVSGSYSPAGIVALLESMLCEIEARDSHAMVYVWEKPPVSTLVGLVEGYSRITPEICPDCHGTKVYRGLNAVEPCPTCCPPD